MADAFVKKTYPCLSPALVMSAFYSKQTWRMRHIKSPAVIA